MRSLPGHTRCSPRSAPDSASAASTSAAAQFVYSCRWWAGNAHAKVSSAYRNLGGTTTLPEAACHTVKNGSEDEFGAAGPPRSLRRGKPADASTTATRLSGDGTLNITRDLESQASTQSERARSEMMPPAEAKEAISHHCADLR